MQFDNGLLEDLHRIDDGDRRKGISCRIDDESVDAFSTGLNELNDRSLEVRLMEREFDAQMVCELPALGLEHFERGVSVNVRLADTQIVEVGSVYDHQSWWHLSSP